MDHGSWDHAKAAQCHHAEAAHGSVPVQRKISTAAYHHCYFLSRASRCSRTQEENSGQAGEIGPAPVKMLTVPAQMWGQPRSKCERQFAVQMWHA
jgi:hypothetical protein